MTHSNWVQQVGAVGCSWVQLGGGGCQSQCCLQCFRTVGAGCSCLVSMEKVIADKSDALIGPRVLISSCTMMEMRAMELPEMEPSC
jgi:hypothetical protein